MTPSDPDSVTQWIQDVRKGDDQAAQQLWDRYFDRLVGLARKRMGTSRCGAVADGEDAALSAFQSFCEGARHDRFPLLSDRTNLWKLLVVITSRKVAAQKEHEGAKKRGGGRSPLTTADVDTDILEMLEGPGPTPDFAAEVTEEYCRLLDRLGDDDLRKVALDRMEGFQNEEIAARLGCSLRTVARRLEMIRKIWLEPEPSPDC